MRSFFVTSTGTEIGKTYFTCSVLRQLRVLGREVRALKPVISGLDESNVQQSDSAHILRALGQGVDQQSIARISPWRFVEPLSPDMAAKREGRLIELKDVLGCCQEFLAVGDGTKIVEGAGGLMSPLGEGFTNLDVAVVLDASIVLVVGDYLGTISHTLTAYEALKSRGRLPWAIVMSEGQKALVSMGETSESIGRFVQCPIYLLRRNEDAPPDLVEEMLR